MSEKHINDVFSGDSRSHPFGGFTADQCAVWKYSSGDQGDEGRDGNGRGSILLFFPDPHLADPVYPYGISQYDRGML